MKLKELTIDQIIELSLRPKDLLKQCYETWTVEDIRVPLHHRQEAIEYASNHFDTISHFNT